MKHDRSRSTLIIISLLLLASLVVMPAQGALLVPVTGDLGEGISIANPSLPTLAAFAEQVKNGYSNQVTGLYVDDLFSYPVVQQPSGQPAFVSSEAGLITQFNSATAFGSLGFLAHNTLAGGAFSSISSGDLISIVLGDGHTAQYQVAQVRRFQALQPYSPNSTFLDLASNKTLTAQEVFYQTYALSGQLILQTCIASQGINSWGRLFVIALPYTPANIVVAIPRMAAYAV